jgi:hypothetical protein
MSIVTKAMIVNCNVGMWEGTRLDRGATKELTDRAGASADAARVNKHLIAKEWLAPIITARGTLRNYVMGMTLPWKDNGDRLLPRRAYEPFIEEFERLHAAFKKEVKTFLTKGYPTAIDQAEFRMGELFNPADYPRVQDLEGKFYARLVIDAVTEAKDFRVNMEKDQLKSIREDMEAAMTERVNKAMGEVWGRLGKALGHFAAKMADGDAIFRDSTIENLREIVDLLPAMNILDDPELDRIGAEIRDTIYGYEAKDLRKSKKARSEAADQAQAIFEGMSGYMKAFGDSE